MKPINRRSVLMGAGGLWASTAIGAYAHNDGSPGAWTPLANMPFPVQEIYPAPFWMDRDAAPSLKPKPHNIIVNAGGLAPNAPFEVTDQVTFYDPLRDTWGYGEALPAPRHHIALVNNNGYLYAIGGFARDRNGGWQMRTDCWRTGSLDENWEAMAPLPHPQAESVAASVNGRIHVVGGRSPAGSQNSEWRHHIDSDEHWTYDPGANRWRTAAPLPTPRNSSAGAVVNGILYVIGGRTVSDGNMTTVEVYDPLSDRWEHARPLPKAQAGLAAAVLNGKIYAFGGEYFSPAGGGVFAESWEYDPRSDQWRAIAAMPRRRHGLGAVKLDNAIYVMGGAASAGGVNTSNALDKFEI